jgi:hypothetical protein
VDEIILRKHDETINKVGKFKAGVGISQIEGTWQPAGCRLPGQKRKH